jgi:hypothetical protein
MPPDFLSKQPMAFPRKFKKRLELKPTDVVLANEVWVTYAVCGCDQDACGWEGWILESAAKKSRKKKQQLYVADDNCPQCRKELFRTAPSDSRCPKIRFRIWCQESITGL